MVKEKICFSVCLTFDGDAMNKTSAKSDLFFLLSLGCVSHGCGHDEPWQCDILIKCLCQAASKNILTLETPGQDILFLVFLAYRLIYATVFSFLPDVWRFQLPWKIYLLVDLFLYFNGGLD